MNTASSALQGTLLGGFLAVSGSIISAFTTTRWTYHQNQLHLEATVLVQAKQLCRQLLDLRIETANPPDSSEMERRRISIAQEMSAIAVHLRLRRHFNVALKLWAADSSEDDQFYKQLSVDIGLLVNPKVQTRINQIQNKFS